MTVRLNACFGGGHGGKDTGATIWVTTDVVPNEPAHLFVEQHFDFELAKLAAARATHSYDLVRAHLIRETLEQHLTLEERGLISASQDADLVIEIHVDKVKDPSAHGARVYYHHSDEDSKAVALAIARAIPEPLYTGMIIDAWDDPRDPSDDWKQRPQHVIEAHAPRCAVCVECAYMSNPSDLRALHDALVQSALATALLAGVDCMCIRKAALLAA